MDLGLLYRYGRRHADEGTSRVRRAPHCRGSLPHLDAPVAGLLAEGGPSCGHAAVHSACRTLVCGHVSRAWRCLCHRRKEAHTIGRFLSPMEGHQGTIFFYLPVILLGFFPWSALLPVPLYRTLKDWYLIRRARAHPDQTGTSELDLFAALLAGGRPCILHGLLQPASPLYWSIVSLPPLC